MIDLAVVGQLVDERNVTYSTRDTMLYALSLGFGATPTDPRQLRYVYEERLESLPTLPMVIGYPGFFMPHPDRHIGWEQLLHAEEHVVVHRPLPPAGMVRDQTTVDGVVDRGANRGAFVYTRKELHDENNWPLATVYSTLLCRTDGGLRQRRTRSSRHGRGPRSLARCHRYDPNPTAAGAALSTLWRH